MSCLAAQVLAVSRGNYEAEAQQVGARFFTDIDDFAEQHPDVVVLACSILSARSVLDGLPLQRFRRSTLFVDVLSVKEFPKRLLLDRLPKSMDILCTHPMFGPDSGAGSWKGLNFQFERVRTQPRKDCQKRTETFLGVRSVDKTAPWWLYYAAQLHARHPCDPCGRARVQSIHVKPDLLLPLLTSITCRSSAARAVTWWSSHAKSTISKLPTHSSSRTRLGAC